MSCSLHQGLHERGRFAVRVPGRLLLGRVVRSRRGRRTNCLTCRNVGQTVHHESTPSFIGRSSRLTRRAPRGRVASCCGLQSGCEIRARGPCSSPPASPARPEVIMRKLSTAVAVAFAALSAQAVLACDEKVERAEQPQHKPAVAEKTQKQSKQQKAQKKAEASEKTAVARADK